MLKITPKETKQYMLKQTFYHTRVISFYNQFYHLILVYLPLGQFIFLC